MILALVLALGVMIAASNCPDHEGCMTGYPCDLVKSVNLCAVTNCGQRWTTDTHGWRLCLDCLTELTA